MHFALWDHQLAVLLHPARRKEQGWSTLSEAAGFAHPSGRRNPARLVSHRMMAGTHAAVECPSSSRPPSGSAPAMLAATNDHCSCLGSIGLLKTHASASVPTEHLPIWLWESAALPSSRARIPSPGAADPGDEACAPGPIR